MTFKISPNPEKAHYFINLGEEKGPGQLTSKARKPSLSLKVLLLTHTHLTSDLGPAPRACCSSTHIPKADPLAQIWNHPEVNQVTEPTEACSFPALDASTSDVSLTTNLMSLSVDVTKDFLAAKTEPWLSLKWALWLMVSRG